MKANSLAIKKDSACSINLEEANKYEHFIIFVVSFSKFIQSFQLEISQLKNQNQKISEQISEIQ
jgi:hypothetical protein